MPSLLFLTQLNVQGKKKYVVQLNIKSKLRKQDKDTTLAPLVRFPFTSAWDHFGLKTSEKHHLQIQDATSA